MAKRYAKTTSGNIHNAHRGLPLPKLPKEEGEWRLASSIYLPRENYGGEIVWFWEEISELREDTLPPNPCFERP